MLPVKDAIADTPTNPEHFMAVLGVDGDTKIIWDPNNTAEVENARRTFNDLTSKGFTAYSVKDSGDKNKKITKFDPQEAKVIMVPRMVGG